ncbi:hypothetical protein L1887_14644 [Cichorium endivia]|nr:hypothetical protein L1887_14644 [Cichorium endivia]
MQNHSFMAIDVPVSKSPYWALTKENLIFLKAWRTTDGAYVDYGEQTWDIRDIGYSKGVALGVELEDKMPQHEYYKYFGPDYTLHIILHHRLHSLMSVLRISHLE